MKAALARCASCEPDYCACADFFGGRIDYGRWCLEVERLPDDAIDLDALRAGSHPAREGVSSQPAPGPCAAPAALSEVAR